MNILLTTGKTDDTDKAHGFICDSCQESYKKETANHFNDIYNNEDLLPEYKQDEVNAFCCVCTEDIGEQS